MGFTVEIGNLGQLQRTLALIHEVEGDAAAGVSGRQ